VVSSGAGATEETASSKRRAAEAKVGG
jgi:hypothetical protein